MRKRHLCHLTAMLTHSTLTEPQNFVLITKTKTTREACTRKHDKRPEARVTRPTTSPQHHRRQTMDRFRMSSRVSPSVIPLYTFPQVVNMSVIPSKKV